MSSPVAEIVFLTLFEAFVARDQFEDYIDIGFTDVQKYYQVYSFDEPLFYQHSSNGTNNKLSSYPTQECFNYQQSYWLPSKVY